jgi:MarR family 2-MHQ and catechol resistance regulon transcriptional repressor
MGTHYPGKPEEILALDTFIKMMRAANTVRTRLDGSLRELDLTENQLGVLEALLHLGPLHPHEIGRKLLVSRANVTLIVDQLYRRGWVRRERESSDRRMVRVCLTPEGRRWIRRTFPIHVKEIVASFSPLDRAERSELGRLCRKLGLANATPS